MVTQCAFCGSGGKMTREHVFGQWVSRIGLDTSPARHRAGPLNRVPRDLGAHAPFSQTVKQVCAPCNNGWLSRIEDLARRALTPAIMGQPQPLAAGDRAGIAVWIQKTALTAMLVSNPAQRSAGYGLPHAEYVSLYENRDRRQPSGAARFWIGRFDNSDGYSGVRVVPLMFNSPERIELTKLGRPVCYLTTIVLGDVILQGLKFTEPGMDVVVSNAPGMSLLWPSQISFALDGGRSFSKPTYLSLANGEALDTNVLGLALSPWKKATELPPSTLIDGRVRVPSACGEHFLSYPVELLRRAGAGRYFAFVATCDCPISYLLEMGPHSIKYKAAGSETEIKRMYDDISGSEDSVADWVGELACREIGHNVSGLPWSS